MSNRPKMKGQPKKKTQIFRDITWLPALAEALASYAENCKNQITAFERGMDQQFSFDEHVVDHTIEAYGKVLETYYFHNDQFNLWLSMNLSQKQRSEVKRLIEVNETVRARNERILDLCYQIKNGTINQATKKDDFQFALDAFSGKIKLPSTGSMDDRFETAKEIHEFVESIFNAGGDDSNIINHPKMMHYAMKLQGIICSSQPGEMDSLTQIFSGFNRFAKILENMLELFRQFKGI